MQRLHLPEGGRRRKKDKGYLRRARETEDLWKRRSIYGKSGCVPASVFGIRYHGLPRGTDASFFLCRELVKGYLNGVSGEYAPPAGYMVDEKEAEAFDGRFPPKEKLKLAGQIFG